MNNYEPYEIVASLKSLLPKTFAVVKGKLLQVQLKGLFSLLSLPKCLDFLPIFFKLDEVMD